MKQFILLTELIRILFERKIASLRTQKEIGTAQDIRTRSTHSKK
jgi:hypothetical protein